MNAVRYPDHAIACRQRNHQARNGGFTLIELLISLAIFSIFMVAIYTILLGQTRSYTTQQVAAGVQGSVRAVVELMSEDLRQAGLDALNTSGAGFETATATSFRITSDRVIPGDTQSNGTIDNTNFERITYYFDSTDNTLKQRLYEGTSSAQPGQPLLDNVTGVQFRYLDADDAETAILSEIRNVLISLTVSEPAGRDGMLSRTYNTRVRCRNMGL
ncbi:MAG: PilW family protein [Desulfobacterales bacterium]